MAEVFRRPALTGLEAVWRWVFWVVVLSGKPAHALLDAVQQVVTAFQAGGFPALGRVIAELAVAAQSWAQGSMRVLLLAVVLWIALAAVGRTLVLRSAIDGLRPKFAVMLLLAALRWLSWAAAVSLWCGLLRWSVRALVLGPQAQGQEASWVLFCAALIAGTLLLFVLWLGTTWVFPLAEVYAAGGQRLGGSLRAAFQRGALAGKLAEINLVLGIVKIALVVLAMVFSACPLPFETVETQNFLFLWTAGVLVLYFLASDYFHVVRIVAFARMRQAFVPVRAAAQSGEAAS